MIRVANLDLKGSVFDAEVLMKLFAGLGEKIIAGVHAHCGCVPSLLLHRFSSKQPHPVCRDE